MFILQVISYKKNHLLNLLFQNLNIYFKKHVFVLHPDCGFQIVL